MHQPLRVLRALHPTRRAAGSALLLVGFALLLWPIISQLPERHRMVVEADRYLAFARQGAFINPWAERERWLALSGGGSAAGRSAADFVLVIPSIHLRTTVHNRLGEDAMRGGAAHDPATPLPGENGLAFVLAHRNTGGAPFWNLGALSLGSVVECHTAAGCLTYRVQRVLQTPSLAGIEPLDAGPWLLMVTCHPPIHPTGFLAALCRMDGAKPTEVPPDRAQRGSPTRELPWFEPYAHGALISP